MTSIQEELQAKLLASEELVKKLQAELAKTSERLNEYIERFYGIKRSCCCHAGPRYSDSEEEDSEEDDD